MNLNQNILGLQNLQLAGGVSAPKEITPEVSSLALAQKSEV